MSFCNATEDISTNCVNIISLNKSVETATTQSKLYETDSAILGKCLLHSKCCESQTNQHDFIKCQTCFCYKG